MKHDKVYIPFEKTVKLFIKTKKLITQLLDDRLLLNDDDRKILCRAEVMLNRHIKNPSKRDLRELRSGE